MSNVENAKLSTMPVNFADTDVVENISEKRRSGKRISLSEYGRKVKQIQTGKLTNPIVPGLADFIQGIIYDKVSYAAAATVPAAFSWFTVPSGQQGKSKADTNLTQASQLTSPEWANVQGLTLKLSSLMQKADIDTWINTYYIEFYVTNKIYLEGPPEYFPATGGLQGFFTLATAANGSFFNNGTPKSDNFFDMRIPQGVDLGGITTDGQTGIIINQSQTFRVDCKATSGFTLAAASGTYGGFAVTCALLAIISRSVQ